MCGRYQLNSTPAEIGKAFEVTVRDNFPPRYNIAPTQPIAVIRMDETPQADLCADALGIYPVMGEKATT